ncbi:unnamed protein product [Rhizophagus irregularis]|nr:unnamed protein product [Rhizophagus irregularis]
MEENFAHLIQYNDDNSVNVPFGRVAEWYIFNHPLLKNIQGAVDFIEWNTKDGEIKSTNRIDDIVKLTSKGEDYIKQIENKEKKDRICWSWVMYCSGEGNSCQHECGGIGSCKETCTNYSLKNNVKNYYDMHLCKVRVISESKLSWLNKEKPLKIKIVGLHLPTNIPIHSPKISRLNLSRQVRDNIIVDRRSDHRTANSVKSKLLAPFNGAEENVLKEALTNQHQICNHDKLRSFLMRDDRRLKENAGPWTILHYLVIEILKPKGYVLFYQQPDLSQLEDEKHFYQLTLSNEFWVPVLVFVVENNAGSGTPLAFGLSNKENQWTIKLSIKKNIPCDRDDCEHKWNYVNLPNRMEFERVRECNSFNWNPFIMTDKHRPSKIAVTNILRGVALAFKIIGRSRTENESKELGLLYQNFVNSLKLPNNIKQKLIADLNRNWLCDEWRLSFINAGQANYSGIQTVVHFVERLYGVKLKRENMTENTGQMQFEAGLATLFDMKSVEEENCPKKLSSDKFRRLNHGRLYFLLEFVEPSNHSDYFYVRKSDNSQILESPYNGKYVELNKGAIDSLKPLFKKLEQKHLDKALCRKGYYLTNILTGECMVCYDYIWNGPFQDVCKHVHAARLFHEANLHLNKELFVRQTKEKFVTYFKSKEKVVAAENKNRLIYEGDTDIAYNEIIRLYYLQGGSVFLPRNNISGRNSDPFKPPELSKRGTSNKGASPKVMAKPRKPSRILQTLQSNSNNEPDSFASEKRNTKRIRKNIRITKEQGKEEQVLVYTLTETQQFQPYYNTNNLLYNESSIHSNMNFFTNSQQEPYIFPSSTSISPPLYKSYIDFSTNVQQPLTNFPSSLPTNLQFHETLNMLNSQSNYTLNSQNSLNMLNS